MTAICWYNFPYLGLFTWEGHLGQSMVPVLKVTAESHGPKNVLELGDKLSHSWTRKETDFAVREVDVTYKYSF